MSKINLFYDHSNVLGCGQHTAVAKGEKGFPHFRIYFPNLFEAVVAGREVSRAHLAGSVPPNNEKLWEYAEQAGFDTSLLKRVQKDNGRMGEQGVDELLHKYMLEAIVDADDQDTIVVVTGDGKKAEHGGGFYDQILRALDRKNSPLKVELWSWIAGRHTKYEDLAKSHPNFTLYPLDAIYNSITFIPYERVVSPLP